MLMLIENIFALSLLAFMLMAIVVLLGAQFNIFNGKPNQCYAVAGLFCLSLMVLLMSGLAWVVRAFFS